MNKPQTYRDNGAVGSLLDEYERSIDALIHVIKHLTQDKLIEIVDPTTDSEDCKSIQTILTHVVQSGYTYTIEIRKWLGENVEYREKAYYNKTDGYITDLLEMFDYSEQLFFDHPDLQMCEYDPKNKIHVRWGQKYDVEQLLEHAIVHILRHRRQIERFILKLL